MRREAWAISAFAASTYLIAMYLAGMSGLILASAVIISAGSLLAPQRTGPFPFVAFLIFNVIVRDSGIVPGLPAADKSVTPLDVFNAVVLVYYIVASCEYDALRYGIQLKRGGGLKVEPPMMQAVARAILWGAAAWTMYVLVREYGPYLLPDVAGVGIVRAGAFLWLLLVMHVVAGVILGVVEIRRGDRLTAWMFVQESFWRPHRGILRFVSKMAFKR
jgi:hypothetical protein